MSARVTQLSYNAGILSGLMEGRADDTKYQAGLAVCRNAVCTPQGPVQNRAGFMFVNSTKYASKKARLIPFTYSSDQTMIIELGDKYARFHTQGKTLLGDDGQPYEIETPWAAEDLWDLHYVQNAAVMTITHTAYAPQELQRYSLTDWRIRQCNFVSTLLPPKSVSAKRITEAKDDSNANKYTQSYVVTALNKDRTEESEKSESVSVVANLYATGTTVEVSWAAVEGAAFYRVYKLQGGIYGYIGETENLSIVDDNIAPETGTTPPYQDDTFGTSKGITKVTVVNGGSGYVSYQNGVAYTGGLPDWEESGRGFGAMAVASSEVSEPDFPEPPYDAIRSYVDVVDAEGGAGKGATVDFEFYTSTSRTTAESSSDSGGVTYYARTHAFIKNIIVNTTGEGYQQPVLRMRRASFIGSAGMEYCRGLIPFPGDWANKDRDYFYLDLATTSKNVDMDVSDETGTGAILVPTVKDGAIVSVRVKYAGRDYTNPTVTVVSPEGSGAVFECEVSKGSDNPSAVGYFEQRRVFAGSVINPQRIWLSATGTDSNFTYHLPLQDDDRIAFDIASRDLNQIQHVVALQQLIMLTSAAEWRVSPLNSDAITPTSISVRPQSYVGASPAQPVLTSNTVVYVAARGGHVREISYDYNAGGYISGDLSLRANELFDEAQIVDLAYSKEPFPVVWAVSSTGSLLGLTYVPEQQVGAWFEFTTSGAFESVSVVQEGEEDAVYCVVARNLGGRRVRSVERMGRRSAKAKKTDVFLDMAGRYEGVETSTVSGIYWLSGLSVTVNADGVVYEDMRVSDQGTLALPKAAKVITVGLPYSMELQTMPLIMGLSDGSLGKGRAKNVSRVWLRLKNSAVPEAGASFDRMLQIKTRTKEIPGTSPDLVNSVVEAMPLGSWGDDAAVCIRMAKPLPFTLISHSAEVSVGG